MKWIFNDNYNDYNQVEQFYPLFKNLHDKITSGGNFAYNSLFEGKLGIDDPKQEKTAIYLLQQSETEKSRQEKINNLLKEGFTQITEGEEAKHFSKIIQVGTDYSRDTIKEFEDSKILFEKDGNLFILPKRCRNRGYRIYKNSDRLLFAK